MSRQTNNNDYHHPFPSYLGRSPNSAAAASSANPPGSGPGSGPGRNSPREQFFADDDPEDPLAQMRTHFDRDRHFFQDPPELRYRQINPLWAEGPQAGVGGGGGFFRGPRGFPADPFGSDFSHPFDFHDPAYPPEFVSPAAARQQQQQPQHQQHFQHRPASPNVDKDGGPRPQNASSYHETIPIKVIHERTRNENGHAPKSNHHPVGSRNTTEIPAATSSSSGGSGSPRLERAHSEPPKSFQQRMFHKPAASAHYSSIPESGTPPPVTPQQLEPSSSNSNADSEGLQIPRNLSTSASSPSVPFSSSPKTNVPVPPPRKPSPTKAKQQQQQEQQDNLRKQSAPPSVRHIPIFVEGREDPVVRRGGPSSSAQQQQQHHQQQQENAFPKPSDYYPSGVRKMGGAAGPSNAAPHRPDLPIRVGQGGSAAEASSNLEPTTPIGPPPGPIPMGCSASHLNIPAAVHDVADSSSSSVAVEPSSPLPAPKGPIALPCSPDYLERMGAEEHLEQVRSASPRPTAAASQQEAAAASDKAADVATANESAAAVAGDASAEHLQQPSEPARKLSREEDVALEKMHKVKKEVEDLVSRIDQFKGKKKDKEYLYLDEMLTRHLLSLDGIETCGREDIRQMRKDAVKSINRCLSMLDTRAGAKGAATSNAADTDAVLAQMMAEQQQQTKS